MSDAPRGMGTRRSGNGSLRRRMIVGAGMAFGVVWLVAGCGAQAVDAPVATGGGPEGAAAADPQVEAGSSTEGVSPPADPPAAQTSAHSANPGFAAPGTQPTPAASPAPVVEEPAPAAPAAPIVAGNGHLRIGRPSLARGGGRVNTGRVQRAIERKRGGMLTCYNIPLGSDPELEGDLGMVLVIDPQGMVGVRIDTDDDDLAAAGVTSCVSEKLRGIDFSETPPSSELWILVPLHFEP